MHISPSFPSSPHCLPSPDGGRIATLHLPSLAVRAVQTLDIVKTVKLSPECTDAVLTLQWSPSSRLLLVAWPSGPILVASAEDKGEDSGNSGHSANPRGRAGASTSTSTSTTGLVATIRNPAPPGTRLAYVCFGASDHELLVFSSLGLRLSLFNLATSRLVEIQNPKLFSATAATGGFSLRPGSGHLALLTRTAGKDYISLYDWPSRQLLRAWTPNTIDARGLAFSPDGKWLVIWESAAYGVKVIFFTTDGHAFKTWTAPGRNAGPPGAVAAVEAATPSTEDPSHGLGPGIRILRFSTDSKLVAADVDTTIHVLKMTSVTEAMRLRHPVTTVVPSDTCQVWSQVGPTTFLQATQPLCPVPPVSRNRPAGGNGGANGVDSSGAAAGEAPEAGCTSLDWDLSSALLASRLEELPGTVYLWDTAVSELRAILLFQASVSSLSWHPHVPETLLIRCDDDHQSGGLVFAWSPLSEGPRALDFSAHLPPPAPGIKSKKTKTAAASSGTIKNPGLCGSRLRASWLGLEPSVSCAPSLWLSNGQSWLVASLTELAGQDGAVQIPWVNYRGPGSGGEPARRNGIGSTDRSGGSADDGAGGDAGDWGPRDSSEQRAGRAESPDDSDLLAVLGDEDDGESELEDTFIRNR